jgi:hypothetical protein
MSSQTAAERVAAGAMLLDERKPGWYKTIDNALLNIASCRKCVLGQVYGDFSDGVRELALGSQFGQYGFSCGSDTAEAINEAWREVIGGKRLAELPIEITAEVGMEAYC